MKKLLAVIITLSMLLSMATVVSANTADIKHQSVEGTAVIDGVKDDAYANALVLKMDNKGSGSGGELLDEPIANLYVLNDAEWVYLLIEITDSTLDNSAANDYEKDSTELYWMSDNANCSSRVMYDGTVSEGSKAEETAAAVTDIGYNVEYKFPITDVLNNEIELCVQINCCSEGKRDHTTYITGNPDGENAWQRANRQATDWDCWWTLILAGDHADTRVDPEEVNLEMNAETYELINSIPIIVQLYGQDRVSWGWADAGYHSMENAFGVPFERVWDDLKFMFDFNATTTNEFTVAPAFGLQIGTGTFLAIADDAAVGDYGESGYFGYTYSDIVIKSEGYDDVVIPAGELNGNLKVKMESWGRSGDVIQFPLEEIIMEKLGLDIEGLCSYLKNLQGVSVTVTLVNYNNATVDMYNEYVAALEAQDEAKITELQHYADEVAAALESAKATTDVAELEGLLAAVQAAVDAAKAEAEGFTKATEWAAGLQASADEITALIEAANAPAEEEAPVEEEAPAEEEEEEKPADEKPADTKPADTAEGGSTGLIIGIVAAIVVVVVVVVILLGKKKK